jgi:hypothetical protein
MKTKKDALIGIRISKSLKERFQREARKQGLSLSEYFTSFIEGQFWESKYAVESMITEAQEKDPKYWEKARKAALIRELEYQLPMVVSDFVSPSATDPNGLPLHMTYLIEDLVRAVFNNIDTVSPDYRGAVSGYALEMGKLIADNMGKFKAEDNEGQKRIIKDLRELIESFAFNFTSMAFAKESFQKIQSELEKTERILLQNIKKNESDHK